MYSDIIKNFKEECELNQLPFVGIEKYITNFYEYLYLIAIREKHEKKSINEGLIIKKSIPQTYKYKTINYSLPSSTDGVISFQLIDSSGGDKTIVFEKPLSQIELLELASMNENDSAIIVSLNSEIRVYYKAQISILQGRRWSITPSLKELEERVRKADSSASWSVLKDVLAFAYYDLSVERIGTTLVFFHNRKIYNNYFSQSKKRRILLSDNDERHLLKNYLKYNDGAIVINKNKYVVYTNTFLPIKNNANNSTRYGGTRRTSAALFSSKVPDIYVITVSDDGPVHVFKEGKELEELASVRYGQILSKNRHFFRSVVDLAEEMGEYPDYSEESVKCSTCGKQSRVGIVRISGFNDKEDYSCARCGSIVISRSCYEIREI